MYVSEILALYVPSIHEPNAAYYCLLSRAYPLYIGNWVDEVSVSFEAINHKKRIKIQLTITVTVVSDKI